MPDKRPSNREEKLRRLKEVIDSKRKELGLVNRHPEQLRKLAELFRKMKQG